MIELRSGARVLQRTVDGTHVLYEPVSDAVVVLDAIGSLVWDLVDESGSVDAIVDALAARFDQPHEVIAGDVGALLQELAEAGFVELGQR